MPNYGTWFEFRGVRITHNQWRVLELLEPGFMFCKRGFAHYLTLQSLVDRDWIEMRKRPDYLLCRLTKAGQEVRDEIHGARARATSRRLWGDS